MPTVRTRTLNRLNTGGVIYTKEPVPISYEDAVRLQEDPRLEVKITQREHAAYHAARAGAPSTPPSTPAAQTAAAPTDTLAGGQGAAEDEVIVPEEGSQERLDAILEAAAELDPDDETNYTNAGLPDARALSKVLGWTVTAAERNKAFAVAEEPEKPKGRITIRKKDAEPLDTGADQAQGGADVDDELEDEVVDPDAEEGSDGDAPDGTTEGAVPV